MLVKQHLLYGTSTAIALSLATYNPTLISFTQPVAVVLGSLVGSIFIDIDSETSTIGRKLKPISKLLNFIFDIFEFGHKPIKVTKDGVFYKRHRRFFHDLLLWALLAILCPIKHPLLFGFFFGIITHLFLDGFTKDGINFFYLFNKKPIYFLPKKLRVYSDSLAAKIITIIISIITIYLIWYFTNH